AVAGTSRRPDRRPEPRTRPAPRRRTGRTRLGLPALRGGRVLYPPRFHYEAPSTLDEACQMMAYYRDDAKVLSGGMSLVPLMKLRFASPGTIVDLNQIQGLDYIEEAGGYLRIGALARNRAIVRSSLVPSRHPLIASAAPTISDPVVRNRGTLVGNCCHGDPQGDWTTVMMCLDGEIVARSTEGERVIPITQFVTGPFS